MQNVQTNLSKTLQVDTPVLPQPSLIQQQSSAISSQTPSLNQKHQSHSFKTKKSSMTAALSFKQKQNKITKMDQVTTILHDKMLEKSKSSSPKIDIVKKKRRQSVAPNFISALATNELMNQTGTSSNTKNEIQSKNQVTVKLDQPIKSKYNSTAKKDQNK